MATLRHAKARKHRHGKSWPQDLAGVIYLAATLLAGASPMPTPGTDGDARSPEEVKAAYVCSFAKFVDWPESVFANQGSPFVIGIVGAGAVADDLRAAAKTESVRRRRVECVSLEPGVSPTNCQVVFFSRGEESRVAAVLSRLGSAPVLTVADQDGFTTAGGMIDFVMEDGQVRFEIAPPAVGRAGLKIRSRLLQLARSPASARKGGA